MAARWTVRPSTGPRDLYAVSARGHDDAEGPPTARFRAEIKTRLAPSWPSAPKDRGPAFGCVVTVALARIGTSAARLTALVVAYHLPVLLPRTLTTARDAEAHALQRIALS